MSYKIPVFGLGKMIIKIANWNTKVTTANIVMGGIELGIKT